MLQCSFDFVLAKYYQKYDSVMHKAPLKPSGFVNVIDIMIVT